MQSYDIEPMREMRLHACSRSPAGMKRTRLTSWRASSCFNMCGKPIITRCVCVWRNDRLEMISTPYSITLSQNVQPAKTCMCSELDIRSQKREVTGHFATISTHVLRRHRPRPRRESETILVGTLLTGHPTSWQLSADIDFLSCSRRS